MRRIFKAAWPGALLFVVLGLATTASALRFDQLEAWVSQQAQTSDTRMFLNISAPGTVPGTILASPSKTDPNYYYFWVRDGAMVMQSVLGMYQTSAVAGQEAQHQHYLDAIYQYVKMSRDNQLRTGQDGMGEPRFNADGSINTEPWGRPQNDGPALRALMMMRFGNQMIKEGHRDYVETTLYSGHLPADTVVKADLEFIAHHWEEKCIDLWEEIWGYHFFTQAVQLAALRDGTKFAHQLGDDGAATFYAQQADLLEAELAKHWDSQKGYYIQTLEQTYAADHQKPSQLDTATVLGALSSDQEGGMLDVANPKILATASALIDAFAKDYPVNSNTKVAAAMGRYTEDYYYGGNPWVLTTAAFAELSYRVAAEIDGAKSFVLEPGQILFLNQALKWKPAKALVPGQDLATDLTAKADVLAALYIQGDAFMERIRTHANANGSLSEQIDKTTGIQLSARDLTWSYASFLRASAARTASMKP